MKIRLLEYDCKEHWVDIPDDTKEVKIQILSGDMILLEPFYYDTSTDRTFDSDEGTYIIKRENFEELNNIMDSYCIGYL